MTQKIKQCDEIGVRQVADLVCIDSDLSLPENITLVSGQNDLSWKIKRSIEVQGFDVADVEYLIKFLIRSDAGLQNSDFSFEGSRFDRTG